MPIYNPITRQRVTMLGRYPVADHCFRFGRKEKGEYRFVRVRFEEERAGGYAVGHERDCDVNDLVADEGSVEIHREYRQLPELLPSLTGSE